MTANRPLIAFAFVKEEFDKTGDLVRGLMPLFEPIIAAMAGQPFSTTRFCKAVEATYGLKMSVLVAEDWAPRLESAGLLEASGDNYNRSYICKASDEVPIAPSAGHIQAALSSLVDQVADFIRERSLIEFNRNAIEAGIIRRLTRVEFLDLLLKPDLTRKIGTTLVLPGSVTDVGPNREAILDFALASTLLRVADDKPAFFNSIAQVASGALVSEVVLNLRQPPSVGQRAGGTLAFLDSPLILDLLDLADHKQHEYTAELIGDMGKAGFKVYTFEHNIAETRTIISGALENYTSVEAGAGTVAYRIRTDATARSRAQALKSNLDKKVRQLGVNIIDMETATKAGATRFNAEAITDLISQIRPLKDIFSREVDAHSIAGVARMVLPKKAVSTVLSLPAIFISKNSALVRTANRVLVEQQNYSSDAALPFMTIRQAAGLTWLALGGEAGTISTNELLANCSLVATPRRDVLSTVYKVLQETDEQAARDFEILMSEGRCAHYVMDYTLGDAALVTEDNAFVILNEIKRKAIDDVRAEDTVKYEAQLAELAAASADAIARQEQGHRDELAQIIAEHKAHLIQIEKERQATELNAATLALQLAEIRSQNETQQGEIERSQRAIEGVEQAALLSSIDAARKKVSTNRVLIICVTGILLTLCSTIASYFLPFIKNKVFIVAVTVFGAFVTFASIVIFAWVLPDLLFENYFRNMEGRYFVDELKRRGIEDYLTRWRKVPEIGAGPTFEKK